MKLVITSENDILDNKFLDSLINYLPKLIFTKENNRKLKSIEKYFQQSIFTDKRKYTIKQAVIVVLRNVIYQSDGNRAIMQIDPAAVFPFYNLKVKDVANLIDYGNLDIKGTHIFYSLFELVRDNINKLRNMYEMGRL